MTDPFASVDSTDRDPFEGSVAEGNLDFLHMDDLEGRVVAFVPTGERGTRVGDKGSDYTWYGCDAYPITGPVTDKIPVLGEPIPIQITAVLFIPRIQAAIRANNRPFVGVVTQRTAGSRTRRAPWDLAQLPETGPERDAWNNFLATRRKN